MPKKKNKKWTPAAKAVVWAAAIGAVGALVTSLIGLWGTAGSEADFEFYTLVVRAETAGPGANVVVTDEDGRVIATVVVGEEGRARVRIPIDYRNREIEVRVEIPGFTIRTFKIKPDAEPVIEI